LKHENKYKKFIYKSSFWQAFQMLGWSFPDYIVPDRKPHNLRLQPEYRRFLFWRHSTLNPLFMPQGMKKGFKAPCHPKPERLVR